jgi:putative two-component system response regulator
MKGLNFIPKGLITMLSQPPLEHDQAFFIHCETHIKDMKIAILDDEETQIILLESILKHANFQNLYSFSQPHTLLDVFEREQPDLLLLDLNMPRMSGFDILRQLKTYLASDTFFPILVLTADNRTSTKEEALKIGAKDFLTKPYNVIEVLLRVKNLLETRHYYLQLQQQKDSLEDLVQQRTRQLEQSQIEMLTRLARAAEYRDDESGEHVWRVAELTAMLAKEMGLERTRVELLLRAARLHDVGKIAIPDGILMKPSRLSQQEFAVIQTHTTIGAQLLSGGQSGFIQMAEIIALTHHERWDGTGYPRGLKGQAIPLEGRILAVADAFDALTHDRPHRKARAVAEAIKELQQQSARQFDPQVIDTLTNLYLKGELTSISKTFALDTTW